MHTNAVMPPK